jgi:preprotein translocase subunit SecG
VQAIIAALLVAVILMQKSEGGGLGMGGSPAGLMSARGAADFLTRATAILAFIFVGLSILLAAISARTASTSSIDTSLTEQVVPAAAVPSAPPPAAPAASPAPADPLAGAAKQ